MINEEANFFHQVTMRTINRYSNILLNTDLSLSKSGFSDTNSPLFTLLDKCEDIHLVGYKNDWLENVEKKSFNINWPFKLLDCIQTGNGSEPKLIKDHMYDIDLRDFWLDPSFYCKNKNTGARELLFPGIILVEFRVASIPVLDLSSYVNYLGCVNNPYSGKVVRCKKWIKKESNDDKVFLAYKGPSSFMFLGAQDALTGLLDRFMVEAKLKDKFQELCPAIWLEEYYKGYSIENILRG